MIKTHKKKFRKFSAYELIVMIFLAVLALSYIYIMFWSVISSLKDIDDFDGNMFGLPKTIVWDHLVYVVKNLKVPVRHGTSLQYVGIPTMLLNTFVYVIGCGLSSTLVPFVTAYFVTHYPYKFSKALYVFVIVAMGIPVVGTQAASVELMQDLKLYDNMLGLIFMRGSIIGMYFLIMCAFFKTVPKELIEAAQVDGASQFRVMAQIVMPMAQNVFWTVFLINTIGFWNEYSSVYLYQPSFPTLSVGLYKMINSSAQGMGFIPRRMAACIALMIPVLILFIFFHDKMMKNLSMGGVKE